MLDDTCRRCSGRVLYYPILRIELCQGCKCIPYACSCPEDRSQDEDLTRLEEPPFQPWRDA
jgi:hypothetical protein